jgi:hypothetical protein
MSAQFWRSGWDRKTRNLAAGKLRRKKAWLEVPKVATHTDPRWTKPVERLRRAMLRCICPHSYMDIMRCGSHYEWCSRCGAIRRIGEQETPLMDWQWPDRTRVAITHPENLACCKQSTPNRPI